MTGSILRLACAGHLKASSSEEAAEPRQRPSSEGRADPCLLPALWKKSELSAAGEGRRGRQEAGKLKA